MTKFVTAMAIALALMTSGCVTRQQRIEAAQSECSQMGYTGEGLSNCTLSEVQAADARRAAALQMYAASMYHPTMNCSTNYIGSYAYTRCY